MVTHSSSRNGRNGSRRVGEKPQGPTLSALERQLLAHAATHPNPAMRRAGKLLWTLIEDRWEFAMIAAGRLFYTTDPETGDPLRRDLTRNPAELASYATRWAQGAIPGTTFDGLNADCSMSEK